MNEIEEEIRRRILAERTIGGQAADDPNGASAPAAANGVGAGPQAANTSASTNGAVSDEGRPYYAPAATPKNPSFLQRKQQKGGIVGGIATLLLILAKFAAPAIAILAKLKFLLIGFKLLLTFGSMLLSMWVYAKLFGWPFGIGIVLLIFIHECGHALAARMRGIPPSFMVFIPFMGGLYAAKRGGQNITENAFIGIMGPAVGTLASVVCALIYIPTGSFFWLALAEWGFFVNLFNLAPTVPLDGGWIIPLFSPKLMAFGVVILIIVGFYNPFIWLLGLLSLPRIISGWKADPRTMPYYQTSAADKWKFGIAYFGLAAFLGIGYFLLHNFLISHHPILA
jgi:Zn-dependent protease